MRVLLKGERSPGQCDFWADKDADIVHVSPTVNVESRSHKNSCVNMHTLLLIRTCKLLGLKSLLREWTDEPLMS